MGSDEIASQYEELRRGFVSWKRDGQLLADELEKLADLADEEDSEPCGFIAARARELVSHIRTGFPPMEDHDDASQ